jgi:hypothetical protein
MPLTRLVLCAAATLLVAAASSAQAPLASHGEKDQTRNGAAAGIAWTVPAGWTTGEGSSMRVATYQVPGVKGAEGGECAVFYFGPGQGGGVDDNVQRWARQFKESPTPRRETRTVGGIAATLVDVEGTYLNPGGGMMQSRGEKPDYRLLGAIVEAPQGNVFFKLTGPQATIADAKAAFDSLIGSIASK